MDLLSGTVYIAYTNLLDLRLLYASERAGDFGIAAFFPKLTVY
jgi:hypothetical protein